MFAIVLVALAAFSPLQSAHAGTTSVEENPMRKIIGMLQDMVKELEREAEVEKEIFDKAACVCEGGEGNLKKVIDDSNAAIEEFTAKTAAGEAEKAQLTQEIADHKTSAAQAESDLSEATMLRDKEYKSFVAEQKDTEFNLESLGKAIPAIEKGMGGAALMQMSGMEARAPKLLRFVEVTKYLNNDDRSAVLSFLDQGDSSSGDYAAQSGQILGILKNMKDEMESDLKELRDEEAHNLNAFNDLKAAKTEEIDVNKQSVITKDKRIGEIALALSEDSHALEDAQEELANAQKFLATMREQCATMEKDRAMREKMRADEIAAVSEAIKILNDDDALEVFKKSLPSAALVQKPQKTYDALLQLSALDHSSKVYTHKQKPRELMLLNTKSKLELKEPAFAAQEEMRASKTGNAAEKLVTHMIDGMVGVLHDDDVNDEHKKDWCANETEISHKIETEKKTLLEQTATEISEQEDNIATLTEEIKGLTEKIQMTDKMVHDATAERKSQHQEFVDSFATSATAIRLIDKAILRLERFYSPQKVAAKEAAVKEAALKKAGLALLHKDTAKNTYVSKRMENALLPGGFDAFVQIKDHSTRTEKAAAQATFRASIKNGVDPIELPTTPKTYEKKESGGVIGLMNDFKTDLKTDMTESETEEKFAAKEYVRIMTEAQETRATDTKSLTNKKAAKAEITEKLVSNKALHELTDEEIHNLELYLVQLHAECDFLLRNYETRHEGRVESETGLESAETIVTGNEPPSHKEIEKVYEEEHSDDDVDKNFPGTPISKYGHD